jgi:hypothetical protein
MCANACLTLPVSARQIVASIRALGLEAGIVCHQRICLGFYLNQRVFKNINVVAIEGMNRLTARELEAEDV